MATSLKDVKTPTDIQVYRGCFILFDKLEFGELIYKNLHS